MNIQDLVLVCPHCATWFAECEQRIIDSISLHESLNEDITEIHYCPLCETPIELQHAHEWDIQTPYEAIKAELLIIEIDNGEQYLSKLVTELKRLEHNS